VEQEKIVEGWCSNCICVNGYHIGDTAGVCVGCNCGEFMADEDSDIFDRLKSLIMPLPKMVETDEEEDELEAHPIIVINSQVIFLGKASRQCKACGNIKMYKEFDDSHEPTVLCNYCAWEKAGANLVHDELEDMEERILENEMKYEEALERQEMIDECLRGLDE
jgi:hypothetical protein